MKKYKLKKLLIIGIIVLVISIFGFIVGKDTLSGTHYHYDTKEFKSGMFDLCKFGSITYDTWGGDFCANSDLIGGILTILSVFSMFGGVGIITVSFRGYNE